MRTFLMCFPEGDNRIVNERELDKWYIELIERKKNRAGFAYIYDITNIPEISHDEIYSICNTNQISRDLDNNVITANKLLQELATLNENIKKNIKNNMGG